MKISIDGGALSVPPDKRFGTHTFSTNLLEALKKYDTRNKYTVYTLTDVGEESGNLRFRKLAPSFRWMRWRVPFEEFLDKKDVFLGLNQAIPSMTPARIIAFSHGISFMKYPHWYPDSYRQMRDQLEMMIRCSSWIVVSSQRVKDELSTLHPRATSRIAIIPFGVPFDMVETSRETKRKPFFLFVGMNHPIKRVDFLIETFEEFVAQKDYAHYKFLLVGPFRAFAKKSNIRVIKSSTRDELRTLYRTARAYITISQYESFNFPALEALSQNCPVIGLESAIIPELRRYVHCSQNESEFIALMKNVSGRKRKKIDQKKLRDDFSWATYVRKLTKLYD